MPFNTIRNYLAERLLRVKKEWQTYMKHDSDPEQTLQSYADSDFDRYRRALQFLPTLEEKRHMLQSEYDTLVSAMKIENETKHQPYELHQPVPSDLPYREDRLPAPGIRSVPLMYHSGHVIHADPATSRPLDPDFDTDAAESYIPGDIDFGPDIDPLLYNLIVTRYPCYLPAVNKYCRPAGTTDATFRDFNKPQKPSAPIDPARKEHVLSHVFRFLDATPFLPLHFVDTQYCKTPLVTGTGYHNRFSYKMKAHARYSRPDQYSDRPTSKGYFYNATYENARTLIHRIKSDGLPFNMHFFPEDRDPTDDEIQLYIDKCNDFFNDYPTLLFTRNHISQRDGTLKVRPVYAVDDLFIIIELMLTFPLLVQARKPSCCIMYGLETVRGSNHYLDALARSYSTFFTIDWSGYDQHLPRVITDLYYSDFLRRLIVISHGYQPTYDYPTYPDLDDHKLYERMDNLLHFLHLWYNNMTFLSVDGYAYRRTSCGVPSGLYNTQYLDSFGNIFLLVDAMIEFGFTDDEISSFVLFVLGDDNTALLPIDISRVHKFLTFLETYALSRYNMTLSLTKSVLTTLRSKIETLGYQCNHGNPLRDINKLAAQLVYPENGLKPHTMSARAVGIAYASAGSDPKFHSFCQDVYNIYRSHYRPDPRMTLSLRRHVYRDMEDILPELDSDTLPPFPSLYEIRSLYSQYAGPLSFAPKWNYAHFVNHPDVIPPSAKTMRDYELEHSLQVRQAPTFATVVSTQT
uniref:RNA-dependent RNA polymerase n=1 Tax=Red panda associated partitivirus TaxID=2864004 RepID=A0A8K1HHF5_9VIRU|nr:RNA-dependent RNA polymerase [Red panda associated partitivirus]